MKVLEVDGIRKEYGSLVAVNNLSFSLEEGQILGLIGPNGAGKTTLLEMLATLLRPSAGTAKILGKDILTNYLEIRRHIGYLPDFFNLYNDLKIDECLRFFAKTYKVPADQIEQRIEYALEKVNLTDKRYELMKNLSRGMVQRMGVGVLLVHEPDIFLLDEPASGLDPRARIELRDVLRDLSKKGKTIIISSHILSELSGFCTHIAIMDKGRMVLWGSVDEIAERADGARIIKIGVLGDIAQATESIGKYDGAKIDSSDGNMVTVQINGQLEKIAEFNRYLVESGIKVYEFSEQRKDLEDIFMAVSNAAE
ncbi:MAG: ABC transporter ATP-binding protein [Phycisphaerae bacterium]|nr:ABC transporter ATP-binding protein [Phycisphaerae bacterium]